ncbi:hypothetical protein [Kiloniella sp.]|uniref:hypothetical protein n=1 Tax=Kiloniella sp. TaxID=1938587 RepID=UPI003B02632D
MPSVTHSPTVLETIQDHLEQVESHGHSHGFEEDLFWAMHGHSHDVADHDHNQVFLFVSLTNNYPLLLRGPWLKVDSVAGPEGHFRIERPPRV